MISCVKIRANFLTLRTGCIGLGIFNPFFTRMWFEGEMKSLGGRKGFEVGYLVTTLSVIVFLASQSACTSYHC